MNQLMHVKKNGKESNKLLLTMILILTVNTSWYIWGNVIYYREWEGCSCITNENPVGLNPGISSAMRFMMLIGYLTFCKCLMVLCVVGIGIPCLCYHMRQAERPQWTGAAPDLMKRLATTTY